MSIPSLGSAIIAIGLILLSQELLLLGLNQMNICNDWLGVRLASRNLVALLKLETTVDWIAVGHTEGSVVDCGMNW
ncbi:hypothetical protein MLD38_040353 [Melastoma candidum]|uniref:Uncharacterized protein n=1 Tax=Melastoma candidum TaxID=119954 RepID=A0ACB9L5V5_9MYRT|nr:hypothetical protein MLD38_040353 [Melastoma candidum]